jgi:hypothetical protein
MSRVDYGFSPIFFISFTCVIGRGGASKTRRLILLISVGWLPPYLRPSGAGLDLGTSMPYGSLNAVEGYTTPGLRLFP